MSRFPEEEEEEMNRYIAEQMAGIMFVLGVAVYGLVILFAAAGLFIVLALAILGIP